VPAKTAKKPAAPKMTALEKSMAKFTEKMDKSYGQGVFHQAEIKPYEVISTGSLTLDRALAVGGYVEGRLYEIWGQESAGKTTLAINGLIQAQKKHPDKAVMVIDVEKRFDERWAQQHGLDIRRCLVVSPDTAEEVADQLKDSLREGIFSMIVLDSIGAMLPEKEAEKDAGDATVGLHAKLVTRMVKIAAVEAERSKTVVIFINQVRAAIGSYGADTTTPGGYALKHCTTGKLAVRRSGGGGLMDGKDQVGHLTTVKVERNSVAKAYRSAEYALLYIPTEKYGPMGIDNALEAAHVGKESGVLELGGSWYTNTLDGERYNGWEKLVAHLRKAPDDVLAIRAAALEALSDEIVRTGITLDGEVAVLEGDALDSHIVDDLDGVENPEDGADPVMMAAQSIVDRVADDGE
jgi:recombination protein RecA